MCAANALGRARVSQSRSRHVLGPIARRINVIGVVLVVASAPVARAQPAKTLEGADRSSANTAGLFLATANAHYAARRYDDALRAYEEVYVRSGDVRTLYRIADTADRLGKHERARSAFALYLERVPDAKDRAFVEGRLHANEAALIAEGKAAPKLPAAPVKPAALAPKPVVLAPAVAVRGEPAPPKAHSTVEIIAAPMPASEHNARPWWLWAGAGAIVVASIAVAAVWFGASSSTTPEPLRGNVGPAVQTLRSP
jgi:tetratricopeptide (TPR) repeat protein